MNTRIFLLLLLLLVVAWSCKQEEEIFSSRSQPSPSTARVASSSATQLIKIPPPDINYIGVKTGVYFIRPLARPELNLALEIPRGRMENGIIIQQHYAIFNAGSEHQWWEVYHLGNGYYIIRNWQSSKCLEVPYGSASGAKIQQNDYKGGLNQHWRIAYSVSKKICWIYNRQTGLALDVPGFSGTLGEQIQQYTPNGGTNQTWLFSEVWGLII